jgi:hypothetical protein
MLNIIPPHAKDVKPEKAGISKNKQRTVKMVVFIKKNCSFLTLKP